MQTQLPPPVPTAPQKGKLSLPIKCLVVASLVPVLCVALRVCGLLRPFSIPTSSMSPTLRRGDHIVVEGLTFLFRKPRRGEIVAFRTDGIPGTPEDQYYIKRVAGLPGEHLALSGGKLEINGTQVHLTNSVGEIVSPVPPGLEAFLTQTNVVIPSQAYYVVGDNWTNSADSRSYGCVPRKNIIGRASFRYLPPNRVGRVR